MRKSVLVIAILVIAMQTTVFSQTDNAATAKTFIDHLFKGEYAKAYEYFAEEFKAQVPLEAMPQVTQQIGTELGAFKSSGKQVKSQVDGLERIVTICEFEKLPGVIVTSFDAKGKIQGFFYEAVADEPAPPQKTKPVEKPSAFPNEELTLKIPTGELYGILVIPNSKVPVPVVVIHAGSGPTDRDGNSPLTPGANNSLKMLAEELAKKGIASLRYDKRGAGKSADAKTKEEDGRIENLMDDLAAWCAVLRKDKRFSTLTIAGHSEGSLIGMVAAKKARANGFISIAGAGRRLSDTLRMQLKPQLPPELMKQADAALTSLEAGKTVPSIPGLESIFRESVQPYLISMFRYDPAKEVKKLKIPVLVINGTSDIQVGADDAKLLSAKPVLIEGMSHVFKQVGNVSREENIKSYGDPSLPVEPKLVSEMVKFVKGLKKK